MVWFIIGLPVFSFGQYQMGITHDNLNVTEGIQLNPALAVDPIPWLDLHIGGLYVFGASNAAYIDGDDFNLFSPGSISELSQNLQIEKVNGQIENYVQGPSINASLGKYSVGISSGVKTFATGSNIPKEFARGLISGLQIPEYYGSELNGSNYRAKTISYMEFGVNAGMILHQKGNLVINGGVNLKYLLGLGGLNFIADDFNYIMHDSSNATVNNFDGKYGGSDYGFHPGVGYGADIGFTIEKKVAPSRYYSPHSVKSNCKYVDYVYRLGFSILDIGAIKFKGSYYREAQNASGNWDNYQDTRTGNVSAIIEDLDNIFNGNGITESSASYKAKLPLSFSLQFDYNLGDGFFINSTVLYAAPLKKSFGGERISMIAITPRFEGKRLGVSIPVSMNTTWKPAIGIALRFWYLTIGTDHLAPFLLNTDVYRLDFYAHIKIPIFKSMECKQRGLGEYDWRFSDCSAPGAKKPRKRRSR